MNYCPNCGKPVKDGQMYCSNCGANVFNSADGKSDDTTKVVHVPTSDESDKSRLISLLLCVLLGGLGIHRFYVGKVGTGILYLFTAGLFGIGYIVDLILIICGTFTDKEGKKVTKWEA